MQKRKQEGQIIRIGDRWYVRYWEPRNIGGTIERKRVTHSIGQVTTRSKRPPADIKTEAERHMATVNSGTVPADRIVTIGDFVERVYLPWIKEHKRPSTDVPRSRLAESNRIGQAQPQHAETCQEPR